MKWHYAVKGEGPGLLFLHGWGVNLRIWTQQIKHFSTAFKVVAIDLPGHGKSEWRLLSLTQIAEEILVILKHLGVDQVAVVASSMGGLVALKISEIAPEKIARLVFVGAQPKFAQADDHPH